MKVTKWKGRKKKCEEEWQKKRKYEGKWNGE